MTLHILSRDLFLCPEEDLHGWPLYCNYDKESRSKEHDEFIFVHLVPVKSAGQKELDLAQAMAKSRALKVNCPLIATKKIVRV